MASQVTELDRVAEFDSYIQEYHTYRDIWSPVIRDILPLKREPDNLYMSALTCSLEIIVGQM